MSRKEIYYSGTILLCFSLGLFLYGCGEDQASGVKRDRSGAKKKTAPKVSGYDGPTGSVSGSITFDGRRETAMIIDMSGDTICASKYMAPLSVERITVGENSGLGNVFVHIKNMPHSYPAPKETFVLDQKGCFYSPRIFGVMAGQPMKVLNPDETLHNVKATPNTNKSIGFNVTMPAHTKTADVSFKDIDSEENPIFTITCDAHAWMRCYVGVFNHPFFMVTKNDGKYTMENVPVGEYEIEVWHELLGVQTQKIKVEQGKSTTIDFKFNRN